MSNVVPSSRNRQVLEDSVRGLERTATEHDGNLAQRIPRDLAEAHETIQRLQQVNAQAQQELSAARESVTYLRRDIEVKDAYVAALRERLNDTERALARLKAEAARLLEVEAAALRVATTPRYWLADRLNLALKRVPLAHRILRAAFVRSTRLERGA